MAKTKFSLEQREILSRLAFYPIGTPQICLIPVRGEFPWAWGLHDKRWVPGKVSMIYRDAPVRGLIHRSQPLLKDLLGELWLTDEGLAQGLQLS